MFRRESLILLASPLFPIDTLRAQYAPAVPAWNRAIEPFRIIGNLYYVGASDVSSYLVATPDGNILIDTGFQETVPLIEANLAKLGHRLQDVRLLLTSHAHYDHVGGVAEIKRRTGARFLANPVEAPAYQHGGKADFAFGDKYPFPPVNPDAPLHDGIAVRLGATTVTAHFTPGHTKGCTSWTLKVEEGGRHFNVLIASSMSAPGYRLVDNADYPEIVHDYQSSFAKLRTLPCDIFLSLHSWDFDLHNRIKARAQDPAQNPFIDPDARTAFVDRTEQAFKKELEKQQATSQRQP